MNRSRGWPKGVRREFSDKAKKTLKKLRIAADEIRVTPSSQRVAPRRITYAPVDVKVLAAEESEAVRGHILELSGRELLLRIPLHAPCGSVVRIEGLDTMLLGEICRSEPSGEQWRVAILIRHSLKGLAELERLSRALTETPKRQGHGKRRHADQPAEPA